MEKKIKFTDKPGAAKIIYGVIIAILCITAIVVGIVAANNRKKPSETPVDPSTGDNTPNTPDDGTNPDGTNPDGTNPDGTNPDGTTPDEKMTFISPVVGKVVKEHSLTVPVYSQTLEEWRVHAGIDISTDDGADVFCVYDGEVSEVYVHPLHGFTVVVNHSDTLKSVYSNLDAGSSSTPKVGDKVKSGDKIGNVGDSSLSELAEEPHLHFEVILGDAAVNPLDYISDEAKKASLGIGEEGTEA